MTFSAGSVRTDEFRKLQEESQRMSNEDIQLYRTGSKQIDEQLRERFSRGVKGVLLAAQNDGVSNADGLLTLSNNGNKFNMYKNIKGELFHDIFEMARSYLKFGELVDVHSSETTDDGIGYNDCKNYISDDGLSGFSITPTGDLISVFNASGKKGFLRAIAPIVIRQANTLDCYASENQNLMQIYSTIFGFKTASIMDYDMERDHDDIAHNHNMPRIAFMVNTDKNIETKHFTKEQYEAAESYRNSFVKQDNKNTQNSIDNLSPEQQAAVEGYEETKKKTSKFYENSLQKEVTTVTSCQVV